MNTRAIGFTLIHFVWQGALVALLAGIAGMALRRARATTRYAVFCLAFVLMAAAPLVTYLVLQTEASEPAVITQASPAVGVQASSAGSLVTHIEEPFWLGALVKVWLLGVILLSIRCAGGWIVAQRLKRWKTTPAGAAVEHLTNRLRARLELKRVIRVYVSEAAEVPAVIGWIRPVILLPVSALTGLTPEQIEFLLAHELAHVRRHDYLVNLFQTGVETILFYHPGVWWVSRQIRAEREHCCDDLAVLACGDPVEYAKTLAKLEGLRTRPLQPAMAADGGSLLSRIQRLGGRERPRRFTASAWIGALLPVVVVFIAVLAVRPARVHAVDQSAAGSVPVRVDGFLGGLADAGYTKITVDEIIALKQNGVEPKFIKKMLAAGLGTPNVEQLIKLRQHGVDPEFVALVNQSQLVKDLSFESVIRLKEQGAEPNDMRHIRELGFGPFPVDDVITLHHHGVHARAFEALKEAGMRTAGVAEALEVAKYDVSADRIRAMKSQGFQNLTLEQIVKLRRAGII